MTINITRETLTDELIDELMPLLNLHWDKCGLYKSKLHLEVDKDFYVKAEKSGHALLYTVRSDGILVGYATALLNYQPHHKNDIFAMVDTIYIKPEYRRGMLAIKFMKNLESDLKSRGISVLAYHVGVELDYPELFQWLKYDRSEIVYTKYLKD
jgi:ribosomal protein S18 acetylase RimI-like enzyme